MSKLNVAWWDRRLYCYFTTSATTATPIATATNIIIIILINTVPVLLL